MTQESVGEALRTAAFQHIYFMSEILNFIELGLPSKYEPGSILLNFSDWLLVDVANMLHVTLSR